MEVNPWDSHGSTLGIKLGDPARLVALGRKHGLISGNSLQEIERSAQEKVSETSSVRMIRVLKEISDLRKECRQLEIQIHQHLLDREVADLLHVDCIKEQLVNVDGLLVHLTEVIREEKTLLQQLQTKTAENSLKIEASHQMHAHQVLQSLGESVTSAPTNLALLQWASQFELHQTLLGSKLAHGKQTLIDYQGIYQTTQRLHQIHHKPSSQ